MGTPVVTLPGAWVSAGTGWPGVSILWQGEMESLVCNFLSVAARRTVWADPSLRYTRMLLGHLANNKCQWSKGRRTFSGLSAGKRAGKRKGARNKNKQYYFFWFCCEWWWFRHHYYCYYYLGCRYLWLPFFVFFFCNWCTVNIILFSYFIYIFMPS